MTDREQRHAPRWLCIGLSLVLLGACTAADQREVVRTGVASAHPVDARDKPVVREDIGRLAVIGLEQEGLEDLPWLGGKVEGLLTGSLVGCFYGMQLAFYNPLACLPGAAIMGVTGLVATPTKEEAELAEEAVLGAIADSDFGEALVAGIREEMAGQEGVHLVPREDYEALFSGQQTKEQLLELCQALAGKGIDTLLVVDRTRLALVADTSGEGGTRLLAGTRAQLIDARSGAPMQELVFVLPGEAAAFRDEWVEWDAQLVREELDTILAYAPVFIVDELLGEPPPVPQEWKLLPGEEQVSLSWKIPEAEAFYGGPDEVTYEVVVFDAQLISRDHPCRSCQLEEITQWQFRESGIDALELVITPEWQMSRRHFWSVRAAHTHGGQRWYTRWARPRPIWR